MASEAKTYTVIHSTHPCTELVLDVHKIRGYLEKAGYAEIEEPKNADLIVISTCAFNQHYEDDAIESIKETKKLAKDGAQVIVAGCLSKINPERFQDTCEFIPLAPREMHKLEELVPSEVPLSKIDSNTVSLKEYEGNRLFMVGITLKKFFRKIPFVSVPSWLDTVPMPDWFFVRAATGCAGNCSYCAIKRARGGVRSTPVELVLSQITEALSKGYKEISLAGDDLGCYGIDLGSDLPALLSEILKLPGDFVANIRFVEPKWLIQYLDRLMPIFETGRITSFCVPIQSGSQRILDAMNRDYTIEDAVDVCNTILRKSKVSSLSSNCMVGFPGETAEDFALSYELLKTCDINMYQVLKYEGRPGTPSEEMDNKVSEELKEERRRRFLTKMKLVKFAHIPEFIAEKYAAIKHGPLV